MSLFLLENLDNYKKDISDNISEIYSKYTEQIFDYIVNILFVDVENNNYIIKKGIEIQTHVFKYIYLYTFNLELALHHMKKAQIYYIEFVTQINNESNSFLKLTLKDSALFVYKKTIFDISTNYKCLYSINNSNYNKIEIINKTIDIFKLVLNTMIDYLNDEKNKNNIVSKNTNEQKNDLTFEIDIIPEIIQKKINANIITLLNLQEKSINENISNENIILDNNVIDNNDSVNNGIDNNVIDNNYIYKLLESIHFLLNFIINTFFKNVLDNNNSEEKISNDKNNYKIKTNFLTNFIELFIKLINKNYKNNFYIDKSLLEKKINQFDVKNNTLNIDYIENPIKFINWLMNE